MSSSSVPNCPHTAQGSSAANHPHPAPNLRDLWSLPWVFPLSAHQGWKGGEAHAFFFLSATHSPIFLQDTCWRSFQFFKRPRKSGVIRSLAARWRGPFGSKAWLEPQSDLLRAFKLSDFEVVVFFKTTKIWVKRCGRAGRGWGGGGGGAALLFPSLLPPGRSSVDWVELGFCLLSLQDFR